MPLPQEKSSTASGVCVNLGTQIPPPLITFGAPRQARTVPGLTTRMAFIYIPDTGVPRPRNSKTSTRAAPMTPDRLKNRRLVGVFLLGWILFNYPVFSLFNRHTALLGIPLLYAYVFGAWALIIGLIMLGARFSRRPPGPGR